jgi:hypothetical protein
LRACSLLVYWAPMSICATRLFRLQWGLIAKGFSRRVAFVFLAVGPATNAASFVILMKVLGRKVAFSYLLFYYYRETFWYCGLYLPCFGWWTHGRSCPLCITTHTQKWTGFLLWFRLFFVYSCYVFIGIYIGSICQKRRKLIW